MYILQRKMYIMGAKPKWTMATARQRLPELVAAAAHEPQKVYRRNRVVAIVSAPEAEPEPARPTLAELFADVRRVCAEENYTLEIPPRTTRSNPLDSPKRRRRR